MLDPGWCSPSCVLAGEAEDELECSIGTGEAYDTFWAAVLMMTLAGDFELCFQPKR